jgi:hypothetical protein
MRSIPLAEHFIHGLAIASAGAKSMHSILVIVLKMQQKPIGWRLVGHLADNPNLIIPLPKH